MASIGLIAGSGQLPALFVAAAKAQGLAVHVVAHEGETEPLAVASADSVAWVKVGQVGHVLRALQRRGVGEAVMAGGIGRVRSLAHARLDAGAVRVLAKVRTWRDDELLRAIAAYFEENGVRIVAPTDYVREVLAKPGHLAGPEPTAEQWRDVHLGLKVAALLGQADVGQAVVVRSGTVVAVEAVEGTDECIRRGGRLGGPGAVVVKRLKPGQDTRFDLPAVGPVTLEVMREVGASVLAVEAGATVLLDAKLVFDWARAYGISVVAVAPEG